VKKERRPYPHGKGASVRRVKPAAASHRKNGGVDGLGALPTSAMCREMCPKSHEAGQHALQSPTIGIESGQIWKRNQTWGGNCDEPGVMLLRR
jgi:hypothetical protein